MANHRETCAPSQADWYVEVTVSKDIPGGTDTTHNDGYFKGDRPATADVNTLVPDGYRKVAASIRRCS
jgi:hypothetical protein